MAKNIEIRLTLVGGPGVGKSALTLQFIQGQFIEDVDPTIEDSYRKELSLPDYEGNITKDSPRCLLDILDTAGNEEYSAMRDRYMRSTSGFAVVYSVTNKESFDAVDQFITQIYRVKDWDRDMKNAPIIIVANKLDSESERVVSQSVGRDYAAAHNLMYIETSAKTGANVQNLFIDLSKKVLAFTNRSNYAATRRHKEKRGLFSSKTEPIQNGTMDVFTKVPTTRFYDSNLFKPIPSIVVPESTYAHDMKQLLKDMEFADAFFQPIDSPDLIPAHKFMVIARCSKTRELIEEHDKKTTDRQSGIAVPFKATTLHLFLDFVYTDSVTFTNLETELPELLDLADKWQMRDLVSFVAKQHPELVPAGSVPQDEIHSVPKFKRDLRRSLIASGSDYRSFDVKFNVKNENKSILAHKAILAQRSPYFRAMFTGGTKEKTAYEIEMEDIGHLALLSVLEYCYTDDVRYVDDTIAVDLLVASNKLCIGRLKFKMSEYIANGMHWDNLIKMYKLAEEANAEALQEYCSYYISRTFDLLSTTRDFSLLTTEEKNYFQEVRKNWGDTKEIEGYWQHKIKGDEEQQPQSDDNSNSKRCNVM